MDRSTARLARPAIAMAKLVLSSGGSILYQCFLDKERVKVGREPRNQVVIDDPALGLDYERVVHGDQRFSYVRPVQAGDDLVCVCVVEEAMTRAGHGFLTTRTAVSTTAGEPVVTVWTRLVIRGED